MPLPYSVPGVTVREIATPSVAPVIAAPATVALVGLSQGYIIKTEAVTLTGTTAAPLNIPADAVAETSAVYPVKVIDAEDRSRGAADGSGYVSGTAFTYNAAAKTLVRIAGSGTTFIPDGGTVLITYAYRTADYFEPFRTGSLGAIESRFGAAYSADGKSLLSALTFAASLAFANGARDVVVQPLLKRATPGDPETAASQPITADVAQASTWQDSMFQLRDTPDVNILTPVIGQSFTGVTKSVQDSIFAAVQNHIDFMRSQEQYIVGVLGVDYSASAASISSQRDDLISSVAALQGRFGQALNEHIVFVSPTVVERSLPGNPAQVLTKLGGQYVAAAMAGLLGGRETTEPLTRISLSGFAKVTDKRTLQQKNEEAAAGLCVIENVRNAGIQIRHGVTIDNNSVARREISVVRSKHRMIESLRQTVDTQIVGKLTADGSAPVVVSSLIAATLERLKAQGELADYTGVQARLLNTDPTRCEVRFAYRPRVPLNYVEIVFAVDLGVA